MSDDREKAEDGVWFTVGTMKTLGRKELLWEISVKVREKRDGSRTSKETCMHLLALPTEPWYAGGQSRRWVPTIQERQNYRHFNCCN